MDYFISDTHFFHRNIIGYAHRPFDNSYEGLEKMNELMIKKWNNKISATDRVFHLGDVGLNHTKKRLKELVHSLNGTKILIMGNHDQREKPEWWRDVGFEEVYPYSIIYRKWYILSHEPVVLCDNLPYINIHGHLHQKTLPEKYYINVSVEQLDYTPIGWNKLNKLIKERNNVSF